jgi:hypothetical protein
MSLDSGLYSNLHMTSSTRPAAPYPSLVEDHASQLIDQLFQEIEQELDGTVPQPSINDQGSGKRTVASSLLALHHRIDAPETEDLGLLVPYIEMDATLESFYDPQPAQRSPISEPEDSRQSFTQGLLLGIASLSFVGALGLWIATQFISHSATPPVTAQTTPVVAPIVNPADVAFANEMEESFQVAEQTPVPVVMAPAIATTALPSITSNLPPTVTVPQKSVSAMPSTSMQVNPSTAKLKPNQVTSPTIKMQPATLPSLQPIALNTIGQSNLPRLAAPKALPSSPTVSSTISSFAPQALPLGQKGAAQVTVQAILEMGDKSAMLIARNGSSQEIRPGGVLDSRGWVFLRVERGQAIIQRGNEVRTINRGESF